MSGTELLEGFLLRKCSATDIGPDFLKGYCRYQEVDRVWRKRGERYELVSEPFVDDWDAPTTARVVGICRECAASGGLVAAVFDGMAVAAFVVLARQPFGSRKQYADLLEMQVSRPYRRKGLGRLLFRLCAEQAWAWGAEKLYISAHSAEQPQAFYRAMGCTLAEEINPVHAEQEPCDIQMECLLERFFAQQNEKTN